MRAFAFKERGAEEQTSSVRKEIEKRFNDSTVGNNEKKGKTHSFWSRKNRWTSPSFARRPSDLPVFFHLSRPREDGPGSQLSLSVTASLLVKQLQQLLDLALPLLRCKHHHLRPRRPSLPAMPSSSSRETASKLRLDGSPLSARPWTRRGAFGCGLEVRSKRGNGEQREKRRKSLVKKGFGFFSLSLNLLCSTKNNRPSAFGAPARHRPPRSFRGLRRRGPRWKAHGRFRPPGPQARCPRRREGLEGFGRRRR